MLDITLFESTEGDYENCPVDTELLVWTGDSFEVEYVTSEVEFGTYFPANGVEFTHYLVLPSDNVAQGYFS